MTEVIVTARKWGNSIGATFPAEIVSKERIRPNDRLVVEVRKVVPIKELFGTFKTKKTAQQLKDEMRAGWE
ncbi:MAG: AbrB/MazE/SpoVT family DNA-binding domain-containing protein [Candidatus Diapherotrites archaeon]|nr:AbrB/MazE/SpoVT family DNA-binding domain-containing protein [Candidatus Diapherotrites archaeon]